MRIKLPHLNVWQKDIVDKFNENRIGKWFVVKAPRQVGKSIVLEYLLTYASLLESNSVSIAVSPTISQARKLYNDIVLSCGKIISKSNGSLLYIEYINGSCVHFKSAEQGDSVRGFTTKKSGILCVDEAAFIDEEWFYSVIVPITNVYKSNIFLFSTPKFKQGLFYNLFTSDGDNIIKFDWTKYDLSKYLTQEVLDIYRAQLPKAVFTSEYLGQFIDGDGAVFTNYKECIGYEDLRPTLPIYFSVDWGTGTGSDDTVITIAQFINDKLVVHKQYYFNDKKTNETTEYILNLIQMYIRKGFKEVNIIVEHNSIGQIYYDVLMDRIDIYESQYNENLDNYRDEIEINVSQFTTTNKSKKRIIEKLTTLFENKQILIPNDTKLLTQLSMFEAKINDKGTVIYKGANNSHDDLVMSLCFLCDIYEIQTN